MKSENERVWIVVKASRLHLTFELDNVFQI